MLDWSTQIKAGQHINGQTLEDRSKWCDWCGKDMHTSKPTNIQGRVLKTHPRCKAKTIKFYSLKTINRSEMQ